MGDLSTGEVAGFLEEALLLLLSAAGSSIATKFRLSSVMQNDYIIDPLKISKRYAKLTRN